LRALANILHSHRVSWRPGFRTILSSRRETAMDITTRATTNPPPTTENRTTASERCTYLGAKWPQATTWCSFIMHSPFLSLFSPSPAPCPFAPFPLFCPLSLCFPLLAHSHLEWSRFMIGGTGRNLMTKAFCDSAISFIWSNIYVDLGSGNNPRSSKKTQ
jgi:hypothetical protein